MTPPRSSPGGPLALFVFIDALGHRIAERHQFLEDLLPRRAPLQTVFGYSSTCDPTILTGRSPAEHGHFAFYRYDPESSPFRGSLPRLLSRLPRRLTDRARVRNKLSSFVQRRLGYTGYFQLYNMPFDCLPLMDYTEKRDLYTPGGILGGVPTVFDRLGERGVPFHVSDWRMGEQTNLDAAGRAIDEGEARMLYLYLADLDGVMHREGTGSPAVARKLESYERSITSLVERARLAGRDVTTWVFSDHGMADVTELCDLQARVEASGLRFGIDYAAVYDSTMARFWFLRPGARGQIEDVLRGEPKGRIVPDQVLDQWGCLFPDQHYGELFFLVRPGVLICPSHMGLRPIRGMHGYDPGHHDSMATVRTDAASSEPLPGGLADLFDVMLRSAL